MEIEAKFTFLIGNEGTTVEISCDKSGITFFRGRLSADSTLRAFSRQAYVPMEEAKLLGLEGVGKKLVLGEVVFEVPENLQFSRRNPDRKKELESLALAACPKDCKPDFYFGSQNSFFIKDGKHYARCTTRKYVDDTP